MDQQQDNQAAGLSDEERKKKAAKDAAESEAKLRAKNVMLKLLTTMAAAIRAPVCPSKGLLVGVNSYAAMASTLKARKSNQRMIAGYLSPLKAVVTLAKLSIKRPQGVIVTNVIQAQLRKVLAWRVDQCIAVLLCQFPQTAQDAANTPRMAVTLASIHTKLGATTTASASPRPPSSSSSDTGGEPELRSPANNNSNDAAAVSSLQYKRDAVRKKHGKNVAPLCPGAVFVPAHRPTVRVDPRALHVIRSGAICR